MNCRVRFVLVTACVLFPLAALLVDSSEPALAAAVPTVGGPIASQDLQALPLGQVVSAQSSTEAAAAFQFGAETAGFLTVVVRGTGDADLRIQITDEAGLPLRGGTSDQDIGGELDAEQLTIVIPREGTYHVYIETLSGSTLFNVGGAWIPFPEVGTEPDPDGHPDAATPLVPGSPVEDSVNAAEGDLWDWYTVTSETGGMVTVIVEAPAGDLGLEAYNEGEYRQYLNSSDQDMQGVPGNESLTLPIEAGQTLYFKVYPIFEGEGLIAYTIRVGVM